MYKKGLKDQKPYAEEEILFNASQKCPTKKTCGLMQYITGTEPGTSIPFISHNSTPNGASPNILTWMAAS